jgi:nucleotide-binding universal stress UspA family protein
MSGITVGIDGSAHAQRALEWAVKEAEVRGEPLTVLTVWRTAVGYWGSPVVYPADREQAEQARAKAQEATDKALAAAGVTEPANVTVRAVSGIPAAELVSASASR